jgi:hypothetical protein
VGVGFLRATRSGLGLGVVCFSERRFEHVPLLIGQRAHAIADGTQQLMEPGGCELRLRLGADRRRDTCAEVIGTFPSAMKQRGHADARLATNHQGRASLPEIIENGIERQ